MRQTPIKIKSYAFAVRIVRLFQWLCKERNESILSKQILRCGTSIGANVEEASGAYSEKEFASKVQIAFKESLETRYWLRLLHDTDYIDGSAFQSLYADCDELVRILSATTKTLREKSNSVCEQSDFDPDSLYSTPCSLPLTPNS
jgi:four helix bundle protein